MKKITLYLLIAGLTLTVVSCNRTNTQTGIEDTKASALQATSYLLKRAIPEKAAYFIIEEIAPAKGEKDVFEIESKDSKIVIRGNNGVSIASGLNWYLKKFCKCQISMNYNQLKLPAELPRVPKKIRIETPFEYRYIFNYCTYGYSMPWWNWERWEEMIDYMAFMGVNMPLATIGQEAVWYEVYKELGMTGKQLEKFFVGPAHLPWGWMGNIDGLGGPLPKSWIEQRAELQKKVLARMRSLGMHPVLQGFTGHVPKELKEIYPHADIMQIGDWAGLKGTMFLNPTDSLFSKIGTLFIQKQTELFGTDHLYDADCFIEVDPPSNEPDFLTTVSNTVYQSMATADPEAIWVLQGWFFFFRSEFWQTEQGRAFVGGVPKDKIIVLDLYGEKNTTWDKTEAFFGQSWIWNVICNEDQKVNMSGDLEQMQINFLNAYNNEISNNLKGIGTIPEGIGYNPVIQDFIYEKAWIQSKVDINDWIAEYAKRRYGSNDENAIKAWQLLSESVYSRTRTDWIPLITTPRLQIFKNPQEDARHIRKEYRISENNPFGQDYEVLKLYEATKSLLASASHLKNIEAYTFDITNTHRELLFSLAYLFIDDLSQSYYSRDTIKFTNAAKKLIGLIDDLETITGTNENFLLGKWIEDARSWGTTKAEKDYYEWNARTIVTIWQPFEEGGLRDYAGKQWNGLMGGYYKPRWELLISMLKKSLDGKQVLDLQKFDAEVRKIDFAWTKANQKYPSSITGDPINEAIKIQKKYADYFKIE